jgi:hypothetical protein
VLPVIRGVDGADAGLEGLFEDDLAEAGAKALRRVSRDALALVDDLPIQGGQLIEKRFFHEGVFRHHGL